MSVFTNFIYIPIVHSWAYEFIDLYKYVCNYIVILILW